MENVSYLIYNESQLASIGYKDEGKLNIPNQDFYAPQNEPEDGKYAKLGKSVYTLNIIIKIRKRLLLLLRRNLMVARPIHIIRLILP